MNIGQAARVSGVSAKLIPCYDSSHLLHPALRNAAGYREYGQQDAHMLRLIGCARRVGFTIGQIQRLFGLWQDADRTRDEIRALALEHINSLNGCLEELRAMRDCLRHLVRHCGDARRSALPEIGKRNGEVKDRCCPDMDQPLATRG
ncbi:MerR family DNA-binding protein [Paraburkholderia fungorum]|uniref:HTH merR-type domain-containing protein n=1 Tax=Paraburkholderia fungorum TaxID=134537 RepID=A0A420FRX5_9BURK|nr:MerR family DNA-binding protein [Paraburkholderia fungorum]RKF35746.1 hypothetical protein BCY88_08895 [Paraburkholderia fungorum]